MAPAAGQPRKAGCDGSGTDPHCTTTSPHLHCVCGLSMGADVALCDVCVEEGLIATEDDEMEWDGVTYPSFRQRRTIAPNPLSYEMLFAAAHGVLTPAQRASR